MLRGSAFVTVPAVFMMVCAAAFCHEQRSEYYVFQNVSGADSSRAHTPAAGSPERKAIMDALRGDQKVVFKVYYLKVHGEWAWADTTPLDAKGKAVAEGGASLLHKKNGIWKVMDLSVIPEDPDNPMGPDDPDPKFIKAVEKAFPGVPADIFPPRKKSK